MGAPTGQLGGQREGAVSPAKAHPTLRAAGQVLGGYSQQLYRSRLYSGTLTRDGFCPGLFRKPRTLLFCDLLSSSPRLTWAPCRCPSQTSASPLQHPGAPRTVFSVGLRGRLSAGKHGRVPGGLMDFLFSHQEMLRCIWGHFLRVIQGTSPTLSHSSSLLHSLGSVTVRADLPEGPCLSRPSVCLRLGAVCHLSGPWQVRERRAPSPTPVSPCRSCAV